MRYRKKPEEVEAFQWTPEDDHGPAWPSWMYAALCKPERDIGALRVIQENNQEILELRISGAKMWLHPGDWVVLHKGGHLDGMRDAEFRKKYEAVADG